MNKRKNEEDELCLVKTKDCNIKENPNDLSNVINQGGACMIVKELKKQTVQELIETRDYCEKNCRRDKYYRGYLKNVNTEMLKRFNYLTELEKEAEKKTNQYMNEHTENYNCENTKLETDNYNVGLERGYEDGFKDGITLGYNKAIEWHYVKDGDLPKDENRVWLYFGDDDYNNGQFIQGRFWCDSCGWFEVEEVFAWKELVPPKE